ncbi:MAG TPA: hypothetical protein VGR89_07545, partial [Puia sp.]|nr:hypothetical protein [Puia sp.]
IPGITGGALNSDEGAPGPIELQGSEKGVVSFRDIVLTPAEYGDRVRTRSALRYAIPDRAQPVQGVTILLPEKMS